MAKHTFKKMSGLHGNVFKVCLAIFNIMPERVNASLHTLKKHFMNHELYTMPCKTSEMKLFVEIVKVFQPLVIYAKSSILDV